MLRGGLFDTGKLLTSGGFFYRHCRARYMAAQERVRANGESFHEDGG